MYHVKHVAISIFIIIGACSFTLAIHTSAHTVSHGVVDHLKNSLENVTINDTSEILPPITEVNKPESHSSFTTEFPTSHNDTTVNPNITTATPKPTTASTTTPTPTTSTPGSTTTTAKPTTTNKPTPNPNTTSTVAPTTPIPVTTTTVKPTAAPTTPSPSHRRFDGPSFIGGIVLALGLVAIGFVAFKFYKARTELNYHTL